MDCISTISGIDDIIHSDDITHVTDIDICSAIIYDDAISDRLPITQEGDMPDIILRMPQETLERIDVLKARLEIQERRSLHRSTVLLRILGAGCDVLEGVLEAVIPAIASIATESVIPPEVPIEPIPQHMTITPEAVIED